MRSKILSLSIVVAVLVYATFLYCMTQSNAIRNENGDESNERVHDSVSATADNDLVVHERFRRAQLRLAQRAEPNDVATTFFNEIGAHDLAAHWPQLAGLLPQYRHARCFSTARNTGLERTDDVDDNANNSDIGDIRHSDSVRCLPGAYIIGEKKSGTSSLRATLLAASNDVFAPRTLKEPTWWTTRRAFNFPKGSQSLAWYIDLYRPVTREFFQLSNGNGELSL